MADKATQTEWSWLQGLSAPPLQPQLVTEHPECTERVVSARGEGDQQDEGSSYSRGEETPCDHRDGSGGEGRKESGRLSAFGYSDESCLLQTSPELDEFVALFTDVDADELEEEEEEERGGSSVTEKLPPPPPYPPLSSANLPWPSILQYLRESESLSSDYFSTADHPQPHPSSRSNSSIREVGPQPAENLCSFCGQRAPVFNLLPLGEVREQVRVEAGAHMDGILLLLCCYSMIQSFAVRSFGTTVHW